MTRATYNPVVVANLENYQILWASPCNLRPPSCSDKLVIRGDAAHWLYIALTGHSMEQHPHEASHIYANSARAVILRRVGEGSDWCDAVAVLRSAGALINPWLGMALYDRDLNLKYNPDVYRRISLDGKVRVVV